MAQISNLKDDASFQEKLVAIYRAGKFRPTYTIGILGLSVLAALLEGIGLSFILPIVELAQQSGDLNDVGGLLAVFLAVFRYLGIPFRLEYLVIGVTAILTVRYSLSFLVGWLRAAIEAQYIRHLQTTMFDGVLDAETAYFDTKGSDEILDMIVTQADSAGKVIRRLVGVLERFLLSLIYLFIALLIAPALTIVTVIFLGGVMFFFKYVLEDAYSIGNEAVNAKQQIQMYAQAGTQGVREIKIFGMKPEVFPDFNRAVDKFVDAHTRIHRNRQIIQNFHQLSIAVMLFVLVFVALEFLSISFGALGVFLFAIFRLGPSVSILSQNIYDIDSDLPALVHSQRFIEELELQTEPGDETIEVPTSIDRMSFENVTFGYETAERNTLDEVSFSISKDEFVAFAGPSGAGKSTIAALIARLYTPDSGRITANGLPIEKFDIREWRAHVSIVHQNPYIFNTTLLDNVTIGNRGAEMDRVRNICEIAQVTEFIDDLPDGYNTVLGDDGVRLSGGQRQRIAIARALLKPSDILILDEATSDLDTSLERQIHANIESMEGDYAILVIAHRLSTITNADRIYTLQKGQIVETGTHNSLLEEGGMYSRLYSTQSR